MQQKVGKQRSIKRSILITAGVLVTLATAYITTMAFLPLPAPTVQYSVQSGPINTEKPGNFMWPDATQVAISAAGYGVVGEYGPDESRPTASIAKVITALAVLRAKPIPAGENGPIITMTGADVALYQSALAAGGSTVPVVNGQQLTEKQALQAMLLPSGNNMAQTLAIWAYGSEAKYVEAANTMLAELKLARTHVADAAGFSPQTVSSARDLVRLGELALQQPTLEEIFALPEATIPGSGHVVNTNTMLEREGISGIKTGTTDEAGGCFLFSAARMIGDKPITIVGAIMNAPNRAQAQAPAPGLVAATFANFIDINSVTEGQTVGTIETAWGASASVVAKHGLRKIVWKGTELDLNVGIIPALKAGNVGAAILGDQQTELVLQSKIPEPDLLWRLQHPRELLQAAFAKK